MCLCAVTCVRERRGGPESISVDKFVHPDATMDMRRQQLAWNMATPTPVVKVPLPLPLTQTNLPFVVIILVLPLNLLPPAVSFVPEPLPHTPSPSLDDLGRLCHRSCLSREPPYLSHPSARIHPRLRLLRPVFCHLSRLAAPCSALSDPSCPTSPRSDCWPESGYVACQSMQPSRNRCC